MCPCSPKREIYSEIPLNNERNQTVETQNRMNLKIKQGKKIQTKKSTYLRIPFI